MPVVPPLDSDRYLSYQGLAEYLRAVEQAVPHLVRLFTIGSSYEGRPLLLAEVTNRGTREGLEKPAIWLDGNLHAPELASSMACLEVLRLLASAHGRDEFVTDLLDNCTFYICPRLSPDAAERCLTRGELIRSATRPYPFEENPRGLVPADVDGDGWIRQMRVQDPLGEADADQLFALVETAVGKPEGRRPQLLSTVSDHARDSSSWLVQLDPSQTA